MLHISEKGRIGIRILIYACLGKDSRYRTGTATENGLLLHEFIRGF